MSKVLLIRPGHAVGDAIFITPVPRLLAEQGHEVDVACMKHNFEVFAHNPHINRLIPLPETKELPKWVEQFREDRKQYDQVLSASGHVEVGLLYRTDSQWGCIPGIEERRKRAQGLNYQDHIMAQLGLDVKGVLPEFYFHQEELDSMARVREQLAQDRKKLVLWQWEGSSGSKELVFAPHYLTEVLKRHQHSVHYVFAPNPNMQSQIPAHPHVHNAWGASSIRNSIMLTALASLVIGPESLLVNAAGAFDTPKMIFFSHSAPDNLAMHYQNCYAAVPVKELECHPCYLICVDWRTVFHPEKRALAMEYERNCQTYATNFPYRLMGYKCCVNLPHTEIINTIVKVLKEKPKEKKKHGDKNVGFKGRQPGREIQGVPLGRAG